MKHGWCTLPPQTSTLTNQGPLGFVLSFPAGHFFWSKSHAFCKVLALIVVHTRQEWFYECAQLSPHHPKTEATWQKRLRNKRSNKHTLGRFCPLLPVGRFFVSGFVANVQQIAVLDQVVLAFQPHLAGTVGGIQGTKFAVMVVADRLGPDKTLGDVGVDRAGRLERS